MFSGDRDEDFRDWNLEPWGSFEEFWAFWASGFRGLGLSALLGFQALRGFWFKKQALTVEVFEFLEKSRVCGLGLFVAGLGLGLAVVGYGSWLGP